MALSDMQVFNQQVQIVATEVIDQSVRKFNEASRSALVLGSENVIGDYLEEASYKVISSLVNRRDAGGAGAVAASQIQQMLDVAVKIDGRVGPVEWTLEQFRRLGKSEEEAGMVIGEQAAEAIIQDYLNSAASALVGAITTAGATLTHDGTAGTASLSALNSAAAKFGDRSQAIVSWLMHSKVFHDIIGERIDNNNRLFEIGNINVVTDGLNRVFVVTDSPNLMTAGAPDTYHTLGLQPGGVQIQTQGLFSETETVTGNENIKKQWQGEYSFVMGLLGYAWDKTNGGSSPTDVAVGTGTNWDKIVTSDKDTAGVLLNTQ